MTQPSEVVRRYLEAFASGQVDAVLAAVTDDFTFRGPMHELRGKSAFSSILGHVAPAARGCRVLRQCANGSDVATLYELHTQVGDSTIPVLVAEWNTVSGDMVASSLMVFDSGQFTGATAGREAAVDPICGMRVAPGNEAARREHRGRELLFCSTACAERLDLLCDLYDAFNRRDIDTILRHLAADVDWPNAWEGGRAIGHDAVRDYWTRQWAAIDPTVEPEAFTARPDGRVAVQVRQTVRDLDGGLVNEGPVVHVYSLRDGGVARMDVEPGAAA